MNISLAIFAILTLTLLINYGKFNRNTDLDLLAHEIGQLVRDAQVAASSGRYSSVGGGGFPKAYGIHIDKATPTKLIYFADTNLNKIYDGASENETVIPLTKGASISKLCGETSDVYVSATCTGVTKDIDSADIVFTRPSVDAGMKGNLGGPHDYSHVLISITSVEKSTRTIEVWTTGQVTVK